VLESQPDRRTLLGHVVTIGSNSVDRRPDLGASVVTYSRAGHRYVHQPVGERARDGSRICTSTGMQRPANLLETPSNRLSRLLHGLARCYHARPSTSVSCSIAKAIPQDVF